MFWVMGLEISSILKKSKKSFTFAQTHTEIPNYVPLTMYAYIFLVPLNQ